MPRSAGDKLGPFEILASIGAGGMGEGYKARDSRLDRVVAVKVSQERFGDRFEREAKAVAALGGSTSQPCNILRIRAGGTCVSPALLKDGGAEV